MNNTLFFCSKTFKVNQMKRAGGKSPKFAIRHAISRIVAPTVFIQFTWHGLRGKDALKTTAVGKCIVLAFANASVTEHVIGIVVGDWLRSDSDKYKRQIASMKESSKDLH